MNLLPVRLAGDGATLAGEGFEVPVPAEARGAVGRSAGRELVLGIRPEQVREAGAGAAGARLPAEVELAEPLGSEVVVHARSGGQLLVARLGPERVPPIGSRIELTLDPEALHLFDAATATRLGEEGVAA